MNKLIVILLVLIPFFGNAQVNLGIGGAIGSKAAVNAQNENNIGAGLKPQIKYQIDSSFSVLSNVIFYPDQSNFVSEFETSLYLWQANLNLSYSYKKIYAIAGINYSCIHATAKLYESENLYTNSRYGYNAGVGFQAKRLFVELKYDNSFDQLTLSLGFYVF